jgi:transposase-like protein
LFKTKIINKKKGKLGAPKGHPKYARREPIPDKIIVYDKVDEIYQNEELAYLGEKVIFEEEIPESQPISVTKHIVYFFLNLKNNKIIFAKNNAPQGAFGKNTETHITLLKFADRLPLRKVSDSLQRQYNLNITNTGIYNIAKRVSRKLSIPYYEIIKAIRSSGVLYIDETKYKVNGKTWWLWVFVSERTVLFVLRDSRGNEVIEEILGKNFNGKISSDGWKVYTNFAKILQRCWAHLLRECDKLEENYKDFKNWNKLIHKLFEETCKIREKPPPLEKRIILQQKMKDRMESISRNMLRNYRFRKLGIKIGTTALLGLNLNAN